jgi:uridine kinase
VTLILKKIIDLNGVKRDKKIIFISVAGLSRSGKSSLINYMQEVLETKNVSTLTIPLDYWILPEKDRKPKMTVRERYQYLKLSNDLTVLMEKGQISFYPYESLSRTISQKKIEISIIDKPIIFLDGVIALDHPLIFEISIIKIYVEIDEKIRKERFVEFYKRKGLNLSNIQKLYNDRNEDEAKFVIKSKPKADFILNLS